MTLADIREAMAQVASVVRPTPVAASASLSQVVGRPVLVKPEHLQRTGSFKIRGAYNLISRLDRRGPEVVAASAGNHAQGVALAATLCGMASTIFMPTAASLPKVAATRGYGATVRLVGEAVDDAIAAAREHVSCAGGTYVPPFDHPLIIAGQGTVGLEVAEEAPELEVVVVPLGGGGLLAGVATALVQARPGVKVVGVQAAGAAAFPLSLAARHPVGLHEMATMADGIAVRAPSPLTLAHVQASVDEVVTVTEEEISRAVLLLLERSKAVVEPAGAVGLAALLAGKVAGHGPALTVLSGGNVDPLLLVRLVDHGLSAAGRYLLLRIVLSDRPGALAGLTQAVAAMSLNVLSVEHHRSGLGLGVNEVEVLLTLETRDPEHRHQIVDALCHQGFQVNLVR